MAFDLHRRFPEAEITGIDLSDGMLEVAREKLAKCDASARNRISFIQGDSLDLFLPDNSQDMITVAYGVRNFEHLKQGYREMLRVLRNRAFTTCLEDSVRVIQHIFPPYNPLRRKNCLG